LNPSTNLNISSIILNGIKDKITEKVYLSVLDELNKRIQVDTKYKTVHFVLGSIDDITIANDFLMLDNYGGELLEDAFDKLNLQDIYKTVRYAGKPVVIFFKVSKEQLNDSILLEIYDYMIKKMIFNIDKHFFRVSYIYDSVPKISILDVKELHDYE
jgi:hypothetical protein